MKLKRETVGEKRLKGEVRAVVSKIFANGKITFNHNTRDKEPHAFGKSKYE